MLQVLRRAVVPQATLTAADVPWARALPEIEMDTPPAMPGLDSDGLVTLYRPVGAAELEKIAASGYQAFPPRLPEQPLFYPVLNERYATEIARSWNTRDAALGQIGHVTRFRVRAEHLARYVVLPPPSFTTSRLLLRAPLVTDAVAIFQAYALSNSHSSAPRCIDRSWTSLSTMPARSPISMWLRRCS